MLSRRTLVIGLLVALALVPARAAVLLHEYALRGSLADNRGGPSLTSFGGQITALGYVFAANQGLSLTSASLSPTDFSIELSFHFDSTDGYRKIADFHSQSLDTGLYNLNGSLDFYPRAAGGVISTGTDVHVVLTRDGTTSVVTGYVNGQQSFSFLDSSSEAVITGTNNQVVFFADDRVQTYEASAGTANYVRVFNGALTASEVSALYAAGAPLAIPEPSTVALLTLGAGLLGVAALRRRRGEGK